MEVFDGSNVPQSVRSVVEEALAAAVANGVFVPDVVLVSAFEEDSTSPVLLLGANGSQFVMVERLNDDGEYAPSCLLVSPPVCSQRELRRLAASISDDDPVGAVGSLVAAGLVCPGVDAALVEDELWEVLFSPRGMFDPAG